MAFLLAFLLAFQGGVAHPLSWAEEPDAAGENRPPVLDSIPDFVFSTDLPVEFEVLANDPDQDPLLYYAEGLPSDAEFDNGVFRWFPTEIHIGDYEVTFTVSDGNFEVSQTVFLYVVPGNQPLPETGSDSPEGTGDTDQAGGNGIINPFDHSTSPTGSNLTGTSNPGTSFASPGVSGTGTGASGTGSGGGTGGSVIGNGVITQSPFFPTSSGTGTTGGTTTDTGGSGGGGTGTGGGGTTTTPTITFTDKTASLGIGSLINSESVSAADLTGDGKMDLLVASAIGSYLLYVNNGNGTFREVVLLNLGNSFAGGVTAIGDYDNDGFQDVFIARNGTDYLLRNSGTGTFQDVTAQAGVSTAANSAGAIFADYDRDGFLDLFVVNIDQPSALFRNQGNGTFQNVTVQAGIQLAAGEENRAAVFADFDNDDDLDLYLVNYLGANALYVNQGNGSFQKSTNSGTADAGRGVAAAAADFNQDGFNDLFLLNDSGTASFFYQNNGNGTFTDIVSQVNLPSLGLNPRGAHFADYNNDGFPDLYIIRNGENNIFLANDGTGKFIDKTQDSGAALPLTARQFAAGDYDEDGLIDLFVAGNPFTVHHNESPRTNNFVQIRTVGTRSNRSGSGARLELVSGSRRVLRHVKEGASNTKESLIQTFGLGGSNSLSSFSVRWPSGTVQNILSKVTVNRLNIIRENAAPTIDVTGPNSISEGQELTLNLTATDPDNAGGAQNDTLTMSVENPPANSTFQDQGGGAAVFKFTPDFTQSGQYTLNFGASDGDLTGSRTLVVTVNNVTTNRPPTIGTLGDHALNEGETVSFTLVGQDPDGDNLSFSISGPVPVPDHAVLNPDPNDPNRVNFSFSPDFTQAGTYDFTFTVSDGTLSASATSKITVGNINRRPVLDLIGDKTVNEGQILTVTLSGSDPDGDALTFSALDMPTNAGFNTNTRTFTFSPSFTQAGEYFVKFQVSDGNLIAQETIKITVVDVTQPGPKIPVLVDPGIANFSGQILLRWSDESASGARIYHIEESASSDFRNILRSFFPSGTQEPVTVNASGNYFYRVRAFSDLPENGGIPSGFSNVVNINVDLERGLDILKVFTNQGVIDGNPATSQNSRQIVLDPTGLGTLQNGNAIRFNYDLKNQSLAGLFFENNGVAANVAPYKTLNLRIRGDSATGFPIKLMIEMRKGGDHASLVLFFKVTDQYQDFTFPFYQRLSQADTMTILVEGDTQGDGLGTLFVDEFFLSERPYLANAKPALTPNAGPAVSDEGLLDVTESKSAHYFYDQVLGPGHVKDADNKDFSSIAATGFGLT
ncbi:MAG: VCBS repeat-containing protein, partial [Candidatus Omnitrophica bacterium]|nr:VCBS repeat-containing protein [Candidatus Omnitrophota bacterium]